MKKKMVKALLIGATAMAMVLSGVGCTPKEEKVPVQSEAVKEDPNEVAVKELKKYIPKVDRLKVVQNAKNLDMTKAVTGLVDEKQKDKVESVKVDDSKLDETKPGTYEVTVTVTLKDAKTTPDSTKAPAKEDTGKTEDKVETGKTEEKDTAAKEDTPVKEETTNPVTPEKEEAGKTEDSKGETTDKAEPGKDADSKEETTDKEDNGTAEDSKEDTSKEDNTISGTVDVEIVDKDKVEDLTGKGDVVITDDNKVVESDKKDEDKKEDDKKDEDKDKDKKPDADKNDKTDSNSQSSNKPNNNNSGNTSTNKPAGNQNQTTTPPANNNTGNNSSGGGNSQPSTPQHTHNWVQQYTTVYHEEVGHNEQVWVVDSPAWDEPVYEGHYICNKCGADLGTGDPTAHSIECGSGYHVENVQSGTVHHDEVGHYENKWVVDSQAWTESVPNGYACSCGATK